MPIIIMPSNGFPFLAREYTLQQCSRWRDVDPTAQYLVILR